MYITYQPINLLTNFTICDRYFFCTHGNMPILALDIVKVNWYRIN